jgi:hypothetical protein
MTYRLSDGALLIGDKAYIPEEIYDFSLPAFFQELGAHLKINNFTFSIQWGNGTYSDNRYSKPCKEEVKTAELAAWNENDEWVIWPGGSEVAGYVYAEDANTIIEYLSSGEFNNDELIAICTNMVSWDDD